MTIGDEVEPPQPASNTQTDARRGARTGPRATVDRKARLQRVAEVRQAIREGRFRVSAPRVADGMLREAAALMQRITLDRSD